MTPHAAMTSGRLAIAAGMRNAAAPAASHAALAGSPGCGRGASSRLALATALLGDPAVLILDEPANGLDPEGIAWLRGLLRAAARVGRTVLYSSHALPEVEQLADQVVIISRGKLVRQGTLAELTGDRGGLEQVFLSLTAGSADPRSKRTGGHDAPCRG